MKRTTRRRLALLGCVTLGAALLAGGCDMYTGYSRPTAYGGGPGSYYYGQPGYGWGGGVGMGWGGGSGFRSGGWHGGSGFHSGGWHGGSSFRR